MKYLTTLIFATILLIAGLGTPANAQIDVRLSPLRHEYLLGEGVALKLTLTNHTDSSIVLDNLPDHPWLTFTLSRSGSTTTISPIAIPRFPKTVLSPGSQRSFQVDLRPYYRFNMASNYKVFASVRMPDMKTAYSSNRTSFTLSNGGNISSFHVRAGGKSLQMCVKLMQVGNQGHLFGQVLDNDTRTVLGACVIGPYLNFMKPRVKLDSQQNLHVLCQSTPNLFSYAVMGTNGKRLDQRTLTRTGGPVDLISTGGGIRLLGLRNYVKPKPEEAGVRGISERPTPN